MNYSQNKEQEHILNYFGDYVGTFLDLGCNDCLTFSNTRALALKGWKGIFIDPIPSVIERCKILYNGHKGFYFYEVAISGHNGKDFIDKSGSLCSAADDGLVSTFHAHEKARFKSVKYEPVEVTIFKWKTFSNRLKNTKIKSFDFISIDIEGDEILTDKKREKYFILKDMDITKTKLICIETNGNQEFKKLHEKYLDGFKLIYTSGENLIYGR